jgi:exonuclease SbcD
VPRVLRLLHTSDWHLGHTLHDQSRRYEHARFLGWLLDQLEAEQVDVLLVAGDVFDTANPSAEAQQTLYHFLAAARVRVAALDIIVVGGNHDSAARLDAPDPLLRALNIRVVGGLHREGGRIDHERMLVPVRGSGGAVEGWVVAVPFLRVFELPDADGEDPLIEGVRRVYAEAIEAARAKRQPGQAIVALGHCYMTGTALSELSERRVLGGNQHALPADIFPEDVAYVALGHLHRAQRVGGREGVRYSGSPIPLSLTEASYRHQVCIVEIEGERLVGVRELPVPRAVPILKIPEGGPRELDEVLRLLEALPPFAEGLGEGERPYLEVEVAMPRPEPSMRRRIEEAVAGKAARLLRIGVQLEGSGRALVEVFANRSLTELQPEQVFRECYRRIYAGDPPPDLLEAFSDLEERVHAEAR